MAFIDVRFACISWFMSLRLSPDARAKDPRCPRTIRCEGPHAEGGT